eukprot:2978813-Prymnesium_polylepis.2
MRLDHQRRRRRRHGGRRCVCVKVAVEAAVRNAGARRPEGCERVGCGAARHGVEFTSANTPVQGLSLIHISEPTRRS